MDVLAASDSMWPIYTVAGISIMYVVIRPLMRRKKDPLVRKEAGLSLSTQRSVERDMNNLLVALTEMTRQMSAQLDTRSARLELLIQEADSKIARLERLEVREAGPTMRIAPEADAGAPAPARPEVQEDPRHADVYKLADQGRAAADIATLLSRPRGEVELILALRPRRRAVGENG